MLGCLVRTILSYALSSTTFIFRLRKFLDFNGSYGSSRLSSIEIKVERPLLNAHQLHSSGPFVFPASSLTNNENYYPTFYLKSAGKILYTPIRVDINYSKFSWEGDSDILKVPYIISMRVYWLVSFSLTLFLPSHRISLTLNNLKLAKPGSVMVQGCSFHFYSLLFLLNTRNQVP